MIGHTSGPLARRVLIVDDELSQPSSVGGRSIRALADALRGRGIEVVEALSCEDGQATVVSDSAIHCVFVNWTLGHNDSHSHSQATELLRALRSRNARVPVFLMADRQVAGSVTVEVATMVNEFVWILDDTASFVAGRAIAAIDRYVEGLLPPFTAALARYDRDREYSWAAPGHQGGVAFLKSPIGRMFFDFTARTSFVPIWA
jgi:arginine decarboxylase